MFIQHKQNISQTLIWYKKVVTFLRAGRTLHFFSIASICLIYLFQQRLVHSENWLFSFYWLPFLFFSSLLVTTQLDAYSRYQNYKQIKDLLHQYGFREIIICPLSKSNCQRDAVREAAHQLDYKDPTLRYFRKLCYRWYHIVPTVIVENPALLLTKGYWTSTFFVQHYKSKYFLW